MKKLLTLIILVLSLGIGSSVFAANSSTTKSILPPNAIGNYNDFGQQVQLDIYVKGTNATKFKVYYAPGYNAKTGFKSFYVPATVNYISRQNQQAVITGFQASSIGWWTVMVVSVRSDGVTSRPFITNVNVIR